MREFLRAASQRGSELLPPVAAPHRTKRFWIAALSVSIFQILGAKLLLYPAPISLWVWLTTGSLMVLLWSSIFWLIFRFGGVAIAITVFIFALVGLILLWFSGREQMHAISSNHALELTAAGTRFTFSMATFLPPHFSLAVGGRSSACCR